MKRLIYLLVIVVSVVMLMSCGAAKDVVVDCLDFEFDGDCGDGHSIAEDYDITTDAIK